MATKSQITVPKTRVKYAFNNKSDRIKAGFQRSNDVSYLLRSCADVHCKKGVYARLSIKAGGLFTRARTPDKLKIRLVYLAKHAIFSSKSLLCNQYKGNWRIGIIVKWLDAHETAIRLLLEHMEFSRGKTN